MSSNGSDAGAVPAYSRSQSLPGAAPAMGSFTSQQQGPAVGASVSARKPVVSLVVKYSSAGLSPSLTRWLKYCVNLDG